MNKLLFALSVVTVAVPLNVEAQVSQTNNDSLSYRMDFSVSAGTTGFGFDVGVPIGDFVKLRSGFNFMLRTEVPMSFEIQVGDNPAESKSKFERLSSKLSSITGKAVDPEANMIGKPTFWNWNVLVDMFPLKRNRHWRVTAGFYMGPSKIAEAYNTTESMTTLMAVNMYNSMYDKLHGRTTKELMDVRLFDLGEKYSDVYLDVSVLQRLQKDFDRNGRMGMRMGKYVRDITDEEGNVIHKQGSYYLMEPDDNDMVKATMRVNSFRPFIGIGYEGRLIKNDDRYHIAFDFGAMIWGGTPRLETHDGTDLIRDVEDIQGKVGDYVNVIDKFKVFPVLNVRLTRRIFW